MKLSKAVKEYISEQIRIKAENSKRIEELRIKADEARKAFNHDCDLLHKKLNKEANEIFKKYRLNDKGVYIGGFYDYHLPAVIAYNKACEELKKKCRMAELNIISTMELGGNKADLMKMLEELQF